MKKQYKLSIEYDDELEELDSLSEILEELEEGAVLLDTGDKTVQLPAEVAKYLEMNGILGLA
jgi:hypothetical protein